MDGVPLHRSLIFRLLIASLTIAVVAVVATSWIASQSTSRTIQQQLGQSLSDDKSVYDELLGYAATHRDWSGVTPLVGSLASRLNRRVTLMTEARQVIADSQAGPALSATRPSATVDPLAVDLSITGGVNRIDQRVIGPYRLPAAEQKQLRDELNASLDCLRQYDYDGTIVAGPHARGRLQVTTIGKSSFSCGLVPLPTRSETRPLAALRKLIASCANEKDVEDVQLAADLTVEVRESDSDTGLPDPKRTERAVGCLEKARRTQLEAYVPPAALLFVTDPADPTAQRVLPFTRANLVRTGTATVVVLILAFLVTIMVGLRLVRPLRSLAEAARRSSGNQRVPVTGRDEIGYLAAALNELAERREQAELQRQAMVSDVAHELRNPLTNIRSWLEAVQDGLATVDGRLVTLLHDETVHLQHIVDDLRDLAAADAGTLRMHPEPVYVNDSVTQVLDAHRPNAAIAGVQLRTEFTGDPEVTADPVRLRQMVSNLLSNAIRHTRPGGSVTVRTGVTGDRLTVAVADTGDGIAPDDLDKVFERFWRADSSRTRATGGSGLGLPIARQIAEAHGGGITVISTLGEGTTFTATIRTATAVLTIS
ncbi:sensor histidine kinase [Actinoplanes friuliensis]|uniref:histidine kinase n=1 Tax=Actinoplanes friuliensis DSM 7358 TaxID=1246995 RepID=U5VZ44_9ACTN|nr:HAMP domain-containing sensor histidine kinase [Actinoplanes friuliensis]AGZ40951.1 putative two-component system sensor kinase [Actinoplanes friuliensis DSM 7358]